MARSQKAREDLLLSEALSSKVGALGGASIPTGLEEH